MESISSRKRQILRSCIRTKKWTEIQNLTGISKPTMKSHLDKLKQDSLLIKTKDGYQTTTKGIEQLRLEPHRRAYARPDRIPSEVFQMINEAIFPGFTLKERLEGIFAAGVFGKYGGIKKVRRILDDISKMVRDSVIVWLPKDSEFDKNSFKLVNQLISKQIKFIKNSETKGKFQIVIDFDLPLAVDSIIKDEKDPEVKKKLIDNRDVILKTLYNKWFRITK